MDKELHSAAFQGDIETVVSILERGGNVNEIGRHKWPLLTEAAESGHAALVGLLLDRGAQVDARDSRDGKTALHWAAMLGQAEAVAVLLNRGAEVDALDVYGQYTPLILAASHAKPDNATRTIKLLLDHGADINARTKWQTTALISAAFGCKIETIAFLMSHGADVDARAENGKTALITVAHMGFRNGVTARVLLEHGANPDIRDSDGKTALIWAASQANTDVIKVLMDYAANPNIHDNAGWSALVHAAGPAPDPSFICMLNSANESNDQGKKIKNARLLEEQWQLRAETVRCLTDQPNYTGDLAGQLAKALDLAEQTHKNPYVLEALTSISK